MLFDSAILACCRSEIERVAAGAAIRDVHQPRRLELVLELDRDPRYLVFSAEAEWARVHLAERLPAGSGKTFPLLPFARKHLRGTRIGGVSQVGFDRVLRLTIDHRGGAIALDPVCTVLIEIMGKHSNILLLNNVDQILEAAKHVTTDVSRARAILPHKDYTAPPTAGGLDPRGARPSDFEEVLAASPVVWPKALSRHYEGLSPFLLEEIALRAETAGDRAGADLSPAARERLIGALMGALDDLRERRWHPVVFPTDRGEGHYPLTVHPPLTSGPLEPVDLLSLAIERHVEEGRTRVHLEALRSEVTSGVRRLARRLEDRAEALEAEASPEVGAKVRRQAEALAASFRLIGSGLDRIEVPDPYAPEGTPLTIPLDPTRGPAENMTRLFDRARRLGEGARRAPERLTRTEADLQRLRRLLEGAAAATSEAELTRLRSEASRMGVRFRGEPDAAGRGDGPGFPSRLSSDGFEIIYGRSAEESDALLRSVAAPDDWWLHARDHRGGHVIVRSAKHPDRVPRNTLLEAARLAAFLSKARHSSLVPVDYTLRKYVRKARKGPKGLQIFEREKTLMVEPLSEADEAF